MKKSPFALHTHKGLVYNRAYLALLHSVHISLRETLDTLGTVSEIEPADCEWEGASSSLLPKKEVFINI